jgi:lipopolysaccharide cholinephosphotransferase
MSNVINDLQKIELKILEEFINVCRNLNLNYFVIGGTLLGAVRHNGFIPWDDDIDIGMPRNDYEVFIMAGQKHLNNKYFIQTVNTDSEYLNGFAKLRDCDTTLIETSAKNRKINHGVYIDIFPLDGIPFSKLERKVKKTLITIYQTKLSSFYYKKGIAEANLKSFIIEGLSKFITSDKTSYDILTKIREIALKDNFEESLIVGNYFGAWGEKEFFSKDVYGKGTTLRFEHLEVKAPEKYDQYLKQVYGDYMRLPPIEKQKSHHDIYILDLEKTYLKYIKHK